MHGKQLLLQCVEPVGGRLDEQELLLVMFHPTLPAIHGGELGNDVYAGGQALLHKLFGERPGVEAAADRRQDDYGLHRLPTIRSAASAAPSRTAERYWKRRGIGATL